MKSRKPTGHIVIFLETDLSKFKGFDESKLSTVQKMCFDQLSEQEKEKIRMGYGTSIIDCESEETICKFNMETYKPPKHALESFARSLVPIIQEFYEDENHMKEFEEWKKKRDKEKKMITYNHFKWRNSPLDLGAGLCDPHHICYTLL